MSNRPNIILFNPDQWRGDVLGHMGNPAAVTPVLDGMVAQDAVSFRWAFCQNPVCTPSRCSFMTGWYPHVRGHRTMFHMLRPGEPLLLRTLMDEGYYVWWGGKNDLTPAQLGYADYCSEHYQPARSPKPLWEVDRAREWRGERGSDTYFSFYVGRQDTGGEPFYYDSDWANGLGAVDVIRSRAPEDPPFCLYLPLTYPHPPYGVEDPWYSQIERGALPPRVPAPSSWEGFPSIMAGIHTNQGLQSWSEPRWTELRATYYAMCARVDYQLGLILAALRETGQYDNTAVFVFSDHGDFTGDYGLVEKTQNTFQDCLTRVPFLVKPPVDVPVKPRVSEALVELVDLPATIEDLLGLVPHHTHFGRSLLPLLAGETDAHRAAVFCEGGRRYGEDEAKELDSDMERDGMLSLYWPRLVLQQQDAGPEHTRATMLRTHQYKYVRRLYESDELYDLGSDPGETRNRITDPTLAGVLAGLKEQMLTWYQDTCDVVPHDADRRW
jgi:arylsulfatase A-like enzyme